jgi:hypothetical protein
MKAKLAHPLAPDAGMDRRFITFAWGALAVCVLWTVGAAVWPGVVVSSALLATLATISAAAIVLALTAGLIGLQLLARYGSRASQMVMDSPVGLLILVAAVLGVAIPLWAAAEEWSQLRVAGFVCFSWGIFALAVAGVLSLWRLNPGWLARRSATRALVGIPSQSSASRLEEAQSILLEIVAGTDALDSGAYTTLRAIALVSLVAHRADRRSAALPRPIETLSAFARSPGTMKGSPKATAATIALLALASNDSDVTLTAVKALQELVQEAIHQHRDPTARSVLDEACGLVSERLHTLDGSQAIDWLATQKPIERRTRPDVVLPVKEVGRISLAVTGDDVRDARWLPSTAAGWLDDPNPPRHDDWEILRAIAAKSIKEHQESHRGELGEGYDVLEAGVTLMQAACASPTPDDATWPGGWRGSDAFAEDIERIASVGLGLYESGRYSASDRVERAIETLAAHVLHRAPGPPSPDQLPDATGWRLGESVLEHTTVRAASDAMRELSTQAWRAGFSRRALRTIRRLNTIFILAVGAGDAKVAEDITEDLQRAAMDAAKWSGETLAAKERGRQLILGLAPEVKPLAQAIQPHIDGGLWQCVFDTLDTIAWASQASPIETSTEIYLHFLTGLAPASDDHFPRQRRPSRSPRELTGEVRKQLLDRLHWTATDEEPGMGLLCVVALWSDVIAGNGQEHLDELGHALEQHVLRHECRDFLLSERWTPTEDTSDVAPRKPSVHWRLFDVARAAHDWIDAKRAKGQSPPVTLPPVTTPDAALQTLIEQFGAARLVDERQYWGVDSGNDSLVYVQEIDNSRRLLRDRESRARPEFAWGYGGTGPHNLAEALVSDVLGILAYCPSCFGVIPTSGGLIACPCCTDGLRHDRRTLEDAFVAIIRDLPREPQPSLASPDSPPQAQWHLTRTELLSRAA